MTFGAVIVGFLICLGLFAGGSKQHGCDAGLLGLMLLFGLFVIAVMTLTSH